MVCTTRSRSKGGVAVQVNKPNEEPIHQPDEEPIHKPDEDPKDKPIDDKKESNIGIEIITFVVASLCAGVNLCYDRLLAFLVNTFTNGICARFPVLVSFKSNIHDFLMQQLQSLGGSDILRKASWILQLVAVAVGMSTYSTMLTYQKCYLPVQKSIQTLDEITLEPYWTTVTELKILIVDVYGKTIPMLVMGLAPMVHFFRWRESWLIFLSSMLLAWCFFLVSKHCANAPWGYKILM